MFARQRHVPTLRRLRVTVRGASLSQRQLDLAARAPTEPGSNRLGEWLEDSPQLIRPVCSRVVHATEWIRTHYDRSFHAAIDGASSATVRSQRRTKLSRTNHRPATLPRVSDYRADDA